MAYCFGDGFDCYAAVGDALLGYWDSGTFTGAALVAGRFAGSQAMQFNNAGTFMAKSSAVNDAIHHIVCAYRQTAALSGTSLATYFQFSDAATNQCCIVFRSDGTILLTSATPGGTVLATYTGAVTAANVWTAFEFEVIISNTVGRFRARKNGNTADDFDSGATLNTRPGVNSYANKLTVGQNVVLGTTQIDDILWRSDTSSVPWVGDVRCYTRMPASDVQAQFSRVPSGALTQTVPSTTASSQGVTGTAYYTQFTAAWSGTVTGVGVLVSSAGTSVNMKCAIYADNAGAPGAVLASATAPVTPVVVGTNTFTFSGVPIVKGTQYWVAAITDGSASYPTLTAGNSAGGASGVVSYAAFPQNNPVVSNPGALTQKSWTYTAAAANYQAVSEAQQDGATSYVYDSNVGDADLYGIAPLSGTPASTIAVTTRGFVQKSDAGTRNGAVQLKSGATTVQSTSTALGTSWGWLWRVDTTDPATGTAWTATAVNNAQIGPVVTV